MVQAYTADDYLYRDGNESVSLVLSGEAPLAIDYGMRSKVTKREADRSDGAYTTSDTFWHLPGALVSTRPKPKDVLTSSDGVWVVLWVEDVFWTDWRCACRRLAIETDLSELVTIKVEVPSPSRTGRPLPRLDDAWTNVRAKIQPISAAKVTEDGRRHTVPTHRVYLDAFKSLTTKHVFVTSGGDQYRFIGYDWPDELDRLPAYTVRAIERGS